MLLSENFKIMFEKPNWARYPELDLIDTILEQYPYLIALLAEDITQGEKQNIFGRKDTNLW